MPVCLKVHYSPLNLDASSTGDVGPNSNRFPTFSNKFKCRRGASTTTEERILLVVRQDEELSSISARIRFPYQDVRVNRRTMSNFLEGIPARVYYVIH